MKDLDEQQKLQQELEQKDQRILKKAFKKHGLTFTDKDEELVDRQYGPREDEEALIEFEAWLDEYCETLKAHAKLQHLRPPRKPKSKSPRGPHRGTFKRQLQIVEFVLGKQLSKGKNSIKWQKMSDAWTDTYRDDPMTKAQLESAFNEAVRDEHIQREYEDRFKVRLARMMMEKTPCNLYYTEEERYKAMLKAFESVADSKEGEDVFYKQILNETQTFRVFPNFEASERAVEEEIHRMKVEEAER